MNPKLSIVIPAYNVERYVGEAVASALGQTLREIEVVVVDDGSTDGTPAVLAGFDDPRLRVVRQENGGLSAARNAGVRAARAPLVGFLDGDDRWRPEKAERHVALMETDPGVALSFSHSAYIDEEGHASGRVLFTGVAAPSLRQMVARNLVGNGSTPVVRADALSAAGPFDETLRSCEDWEMWVRLLRVTGLAARLVPEPLTEYRVNTRSLSMDFTSFLTQAEAAAARIGRETPSVPAGEARLGLAICYRLCATKAIRNGQRRQAVSLLASALRRYPALPLRDPRFASTLILAGAPVGAMDAVNRLSARFLARGALSKTA